MKYKYVDDFEIRNDEKVSLTKNGNVVDELDIRSLVQNWLDEHEEDDFSPIEVN